MVGPAPAPFPGAKKQLLTVANVTSPRQLSFGIAFRSPDQCRPHSVLVCCHVDAREGERRTLVGKRNTRKEYCDAAT